MSPPAVLFKDQSKHYGPCATIVPRASAQRQLAGHESTLGASAALTGYTQHPGSDRPRVTDARETLNTLLPQFLEVTFLLILQTQAAMLGAGVIRSALEREIQTQHLGNRAQTGTYAHACTPPASDGPVHTRGSIPHHSPSAVSAGGRKPRPQGWAVSPPNHDLGQQTSPRTKLLSQSGLLLWPAVFPVFAGKFLKSGNSVHSLDLSS